MLGRSLKILPIVRKSVSFFASTQQYVAPPSQLQQFKKHLTKNDIQEQRVAAMMLAIHEADDQIYQAQLKQIAKDWEYHQTNSRQIIQLVQNSTLLTNMVGEQIKQNQRIEERCLKEIQNAKLYAISKTAKQVIQVADHLNHAIRDVRQKTHDNQEQQLKQLLLLQQQLTKVFQKYHIQEFNPIEQLFNPNEQESVGVVPTDDQSKHNTIAQVQRSGFRIKDRLLRSAYVFIYQFTKPV